MFWIDKSFGMVYGRKFTFIILKAKYRDSQLYDLEFKIENQYLRKQNYL